MLKLWFDEIGCPRFTWTFFFEYLYVFVCAVCVLKEVPGKNDTYLLTHYGFLHQANLRASRGRSRFATFFKVQVLV